MPGKINVAAVKAAPRPNRPGQPYAPDASALVGARELTTEEYAFLRKRWEGDKSAPSFNRFATNRLVIQQGVLLNVGPNAWAFMALEDRDRKMENEGWFKKVQDRTRPAPTAR